MVAKAATEQAVMARVLQVGRAKLENLLVVVETMLPLKGRENNRWLVEVDYGISFFVNFYLKVPLK